MRKKKFLRRESGRLKRVGKGRKKKQKWRRPKGRDNKMRLGERGYPRTVSIGYKKSDKDKMKPIEKTMGVEGMKGLKKGDKIMLGKLGKKKKTELAEEAKKKGLQISNLNIKKLLRKVEREKKKKQEEKEKAKKEKKKGEKRKEVKENIKKMEKEGEERKEDTKQ